MRAAIQAGMHSLGFSGHAPVGFTTDWNMSERALQDYLRDFRAVKERYGSRLPLFLGLEVDYVPGLLGPSSDRVRALGLDYVIGSIHFLGRMADGNWWTVDSSPAELRAGIDESFAGDVRRAVERYYRLIAEMAAESRPDIVGHLDVIRKFNRGDRFFDERSPWYRTAVLESLDTIARSGCMIEVNTGAISRGYTSTPYPSAWILAECRRRGIPAVISADAHDPSHLVGLHAMAVEALRTAGYGVQMLRGERGWEASPL